MVKRLSAFGCAVLLTLLLSISAYAATSSVVHMDFPFFSRAVFQQPSGTALAQLDVGQRPFSSWASTVTGAGSGSPAINFYLGNTFQLEGVQDTQTVSFDIPVYTGMTGGSQSISGTQSQYGIISLSSGATTYVLNRVDRTVSIDIDNSETLTLKNDIVATGDYLITGYFDFAHQTFGGQDAVDQMFRSPRVRTVLSGKYENIEVVHSQYTYILSGAGQALRDRVSWSVLIRIPVAVQGNVRFDLYNFGDAIPSVTGFGVSTGAVEYQDSVTGIAGLSAQLANYFNKLISGIGSIGSKITQQDQDAADAANDSTLRDDTASKSQDIDTIESFESSMLDGMNSNLDNVDFTVPTNFGAAATFVSWIVRGMFNRLGGYQIVIVFPLIIGLTLLLIGRGQSALGRIMSSPPSQSRELPGQQSFFDK